MTGKNLFINCQIMKKRLTSLSLMRIHQNKRSLKNLYIFQVFKEVVIVCVGRYFGTQFTGYLLGYTSLQSKTRMRIKSLVVIKGHH